MYNFHCQSLIPKDDLTFKTTSFSAKVRVKTGILVGGDGVEEGNENIFLDLVCVNSLDEG